jgi:DNA-binding response OmpR family regulator
LEIIDKAILYLHIFIANSNDYYLLFRIWILIITGEYFSTMRLLVCEDNKLVIKTLSVVLGKEGFEVDIADDGNKAFEFLHKSKYDLILVDIHLPFHSGLEIIKFLRSDLKQRTPVLVLSAFSDQEIQKQAGEMEIEAYIVKPFNPSDLIRKIRSILKLDL